MDQESLQKLLRLKRHEVPSEAYFESFLDEFHQRQRRELLQRSSLGLLFERVNTYLADPRSQGWAYAPVLAVFFVAFYLIIGMTAAESSSLPSVLAPAPIEASQAPVHYAYNQLAQAGPAMAPQQASWPGPFQPMHTVNVPPAPIQASTVINARLQLPLSLEELLNPIGN